MSHFTVLVLFTEKEFKGADKNESKLNKILTKRLQPYHEYECTGVDDEYVKDIDITDELKEDYEKETIDLAFDDKGNPVDYYGDSFYREPTEEEKESIGPLGGTGGSKLKDGTHFSFSSRDWKDGKGYRTKVRYTPEGFTTKEALYKDHHSFEHYVTEYHEKELIDGKVTRRTNPNAKWDWWVVGGRWAGALIGVQPEDNPKNYRRCQYCGGTGTRPGSHFKEANKLYPVIGEGCNVCMGTGMAFKYNSEWEKVQNWLPVSEITDFTPFAFVTPEGDWIERGKMGWWACVADEKDKDVWKDEVKKIYDKYKDCIAVLVDCHI